MNTATNNDAAFGEDAQGRRHKGTDGREDDCGVQFLRRHFIGAAGPDRAETACRFLTSFVGRSGECENFAALVNRDLPDHVRGIAETVNAEAMRVASFAIGAVAEHAGAQKRRRLDIVVFVRQMKTKSRVRNGELGVTPINSVAGKLRAVAKVFALRSTISAFPVRPAQPRNANSVTGGKSLDVLAYLFDASNDLMPGDERQFRIRQLAIDNVKVGAANGTSSNTNEQLSRAQFRFWRVTRAKRLPWFFENHRAHVDLITSQFKNPKSETNFETRNAIRLRRIEILRDLWRFGFY